MMKLFSNWHLVRILQLVMGVLLLGSYLFYTADGITLAFGLILLVQAAFNISCVSGACAVPNRRYDQVSIPTDEVTYEEING